MGTNDSADEKVQATNVPMTGAALFSLLYPYGNQPPRLIAAINDTVTDCPAEGTLFGNYGQARKKSDELRSKPKDGPKYPSKVGEVMARLPIPIAHVIHLKNGDKLLASAPIPKLVQTDELVPQVLEPAEAIGQILRWVTGRLDHSWETIWASQLGATLQWRTPDPDKVDDPAKISADAKDEEAWARVVTQLLFAVDYAGVADLYAMGVVGKSTPPGESWEQFVYRRIEPEAIIPQPYSIDYVDTKEKDVSKRNKTRVHGGHHVKSWIDPRWAPVSGKPDITHKKEENLDPAAPITAACQHSATLVSLMRGYPLYWMGDVVNRAVGYMASNSCRDMAIFGRDYSKHEEGPFGGAKGLVPEVPAGGAWVPATSAPIVLHVLQPETGPSASDEEQAYGESATPAKHPPPGCPGTIFVWDPDWDLDKDVTIYMTWYEANYRADFVKSQFLATRTGVGGGDFSKAYLEKGKRVPKATDIPDDAKVEKLKAAEDTQIKTMTDLIAAEKAKKSPNQGQINMWEKAKTSAEQRKAELTAGKAKSTETNIGVPYNRNQQLPGSHINAILRVSFKKDALQLFDTGLGSHYEVLARTGSEAILPVNGGGATCDGYRQPYFGAGAENAGAVAQEDSNQQLSAGTGKQYAGYGVPPPSPRKLADQTAFLSKARPVGLIRFALTRRVAALYNEPDVLFVSTLRPMYGRADTERYPISKLLWSLRHTPGFTNIQPWWLVYVPRGLLAKCMWAHKPTAEEAKAAGVPQMMMLEDFKAHFSKPAFADDLSVLRFFQRYEPLQWPPKPGKEMDAARERVKEGKMYDGTHYFLVEALTNHGSDSPAAAGQAHLFTKFRYEYGKSMPQMSGGFDWFKTLQRVAGRLSWDEMWLSPQIEAHRDAIAQKLPPFFPAPVAKPAPAAAKK